MDPDAAQEARVRFALLDLRLSLNDAYERLEDARRALIWIATADGEPDGDGGRENVRRYLESASKEIFSAVCAAPYLALNRENVDPSPLEEA